ncbi:hypothetical protein ACQP00_24075 [Dactylosporangium sp. CS-047395]|uniref:hypothetical protein n=1 Tax=Dactylosporangium sp. CS-047395 TaxID=3239936 RepID=UPI003D937E2C
MRWRSTAMFWALLAAVDGVLLVFGLREQLYVQAGVLTLATVVAVVATQPSIAWAATGSTRFRRALRLGAGVAAIASLPAAGWYGTWVVLRGLSEASLWLVVGGLVLGTVIPGAVLIALGALVDSGSPASDSAVAALACHVVVSGAGLLATAVAFAAMAHNWSLVGVVGALLVWRLAGPAVRGFRSVRRTWRIGTGTPLVARLTGLAIALLPLLWAGPDPLGTAPRGTDLLRLLAVVLAVAVVQHAVLVWWKPGRLLAQLDLVAAEVRRSAVDELHALAALRGIASPGTGPPTETAHDLQLRRAEHSAWHRSASERLRLLQSLDADQYAYHKRRFDAIAAAREEALNRDAAGARSSGRRPSPALPDQQEESYRAGRAAWDRLTRVLQVEESLAAGSVGVRLLAPVDSRAAVRANRQATVRTGLVLDEAWPRVALVVPPRERRAVAATDAAIAGWRVLAASAFCAVGSTLVAAVWTSWTERTFLLAAVAMLGAVVALQRARADVVRGYDRRAAAVDIYQVEALRRIGLTVPAYPAAPVALAGALMGRPDELEPQDLVVMDELVHRRAQEVVTNINPEVVNHMQVRGAEPDWALHEAVARLTEEVRASKETVGQVHRLERELSDQRTMLEERIQDHVRAGFESVIQGPPRVNYQGWINVDIVADDEHVEVAADGTFAIGEGGAFELVVRIAAERAWPLAEQLVVTGGIDRRPVPFDVEVDSDRPELRREARPVLVMPARGGDEVRFAYALGAVDFPAPPWLWIRVSQGRRTLQSIELTLEAGTERATA